MILPVITNACEEIGCDEPDLSCNGCAKTRQRDADQQIVNSLTELLEKINKIIYDEYNRTEGENKSVCFIGEEVEKITKKALEGK